MTRCLNCGAERAADACEACGMTTAAAEFAVRRGLLNRTAIFLLGAMAALAASVRYPPLELDGILIFIGLLFFLTLALAVWLERRTMRHLEVEHLKRIFYGLVPAPWILAGLMFANGVLDRKPPEEKPARVVSRFSMLGILPSQRLVVTSWREGRRFERVPVSRDDFNRFRDGDAVVVHVKDGLVGIPWVYAVYHR